MDLISKYQALAPAEGVDLLGYYMAPFGYAYLQVLADAIQATQSLDDDKLADYIHGHSFKTVLGDISFGKNGEWTHSRVLQIQFQHIKGNGLDQFKDVSTQVIVSPDQYQSGKVIFPYEKAKE